MKFQEKTHTHKLIKSKSIFQRSIRRMKEIQTYVKENIIDEKRIPKTTSSSLKCNNFEFGKRK